ncbi:MAG: PQQ-binding-like beta-propeller repeat protein [Sedimentisphaerales bacterium]|nr:PQQ-binding-like beta-propeller repeat protein [Sedimentisphaerales bacterium]
MINRKLLSMFVAFFIISFCFLATSAGADWPMWRHDAQRSGTSEAELPKELHLQWSRQLPRPQPAFPSEPRQCFDGSYEPVVLAKTMFVPSMVNDSVTAIDTESGRIKWKYFTEGPVRFAPAAEQGKVYFVCDDGYLYCVAAQTGELVWKYKAGPADIEARKLLGNSRLISRWPARGGPVLVEGVVYFAAGIFPFEGVYVYALDARTGKVIWINKESGFIKKGLNDHGGSRDGGLSPQGYLTVTGDKLIVPNGKALPIFFDRKTGQIEPYKPAWGGRAILEKGCWYVSAMGKYYLQSGDVYDLTTRKRLQIDPGQIFKELGDFREPIFTAEAMYYSEPVNEQLSSDYRAYRPVGMGYEKIIAYDINKTGHEEKKDKLYGFSEVTWKSLTFEKIFQLESNLKVHIKSGSRLYASGENLVAAVDISPATDQPKISWRAKIEGTVHRMLTADDKLFVVTKEGAFYCFGGKQMQPKIYKLEYHAAEKNVKWAAKAKEIFDLTKVKQGYCIALGWATGRLVAELARQSDLHIIVLEKNAKVVMAARKQLDVQGLNGSRIHVLSDELSMAQLPSYLANLIVSEDLSSAGFKPEGVFAEKLFDVMRPYGSLACLSLSGTEHKRLAAWFKQTKLGDAENRAVVKKQSYYTLLTRQGSLVGSSDWTHEAATAGNTFASSDMLVKGPFGVLWFGGTADNIFPEWDFTHWRGPSPLVVEGRMFISIGTELYAVDIYTGRVLWQKKLAEMEELKASQRRYKFDNYVAVKDGIYVNCGSTCLKLDPASGTTLSQIETPVELGDKVLPDRELNGKESTGKDRPRWGQVRIWNNCFIGAAGKYLIGLNRHSNEKLWQIESEKGNFNFALGNEKVFVIDYLGDSAKETTEAKYKLIVLDVDHGEIIWDKELEVKSAKKIKQPLASKLTYGQDQDILLITVHDKTVGAFIGATGELLWQKDIPCNDPPSPWSPPEPPILLRDLMVTHGGKLYNPQTGKEMPRRFWHGMNADMAKGGARGCGRAVAGEFLVTVRDAHASYFDLSTGRQNYFRGIRSGCTNNLVPAGGLLNAPNYSRGCSCNYPIYTSLAWLHMPEAVAWTEDASK